MPYDLVISGAEDFAALAKKLRTAGNGKELRKELNKSITQAVRPLRKDVKDSAKRTLPKRGGYARLIGKSAIRTKKRTVGAGAGIRIVATNAHDIARLDKPGRLRHPLYGNRGFWYEQRVKAGWFTRPLRKGAPKVRRELDRAISRLVKRIEN